jgi:CubicO group peptidase (beta-lactamase class C family)
MGPAAGAAALDERVRAAVGGKVPGVALIVVGAEGVRARSAVGLADLAAQAPMRTDLVIPWFSMTKIATATTAMRLVERGLLELDTPVLPLVPAMGALRPAAWAQRITARHLLQHSAGLANPVPVRWIHPTETPGPDPNEFLTRLLARHAKLRFQPGARSSYSNLGTLTLGAAIARASQTRFEAVLRHEVLEPVGMTDSGFSYTAGAPAATGYHPRRSPMRLLLPRWVAGPGVGAVAGPSPVPAGRRRLRRAGRDHRGRRPVPAPAPAQRRAGRHPRALCRGRGGDATHRAAGSPL